MSNNKKKDFLDVLTSISDTDLNEYIKRHGKPPKPVDMCIIVDKLGIEPSEDNNKIL